MSENRYARLNGRIIKVHTFIDFCFIDFDGNEHRCQQAILENEEQVDINDVELLTEDDLYVEELKACQDGRQNGLIRESS